MRIASHEVVKRSALKGQKCFAFLSLLMVFALRPGGAFAAEYQFSLIAEASSLDTSLPFTSFRLAPSVSQAGVVAFSASVRNPDVNTGIYLGSGEGLTFGDYTAVAQDLTSSTTDLSNFVVGQFSNDSVAFTARDGTGTNGIFLGDGGAVSTVVSDPFVNIFRGLSINASGQAAFKTNEDLGDGDGLEDALATGLNGIRSVRFNGSFGSNPNGKVIRSMTGSPSPKIDDTGNIAFTATRFEEPTNPSNGTLLDGVFLSTGGSVIESIVVEGDTFNGMTIDEINPSTAFDRNSAGVAVVRASTENDVEHVFLRNGSSLTSLVSRGFFDSSPGDFRDFRELAINNNGDIAMLADRFDSEGIRRRGLFLMGEGESEFTQVVGVGDSMFGSEVAFVTSFDRFGLNDNGQLAYQVSLADGRNVIGLASLVGDSSRWALAVDGDFSNEMKWEPNIVPIAGREAIFDTDGTYTVDIDASVTIGKLNATAGTVTFDFDGTSLTGTDLTVGGDGQATTLTLRAAEEPIVASIAALHEPNHVPSTLGQVQWENVFVLDEGVLQVISDRPLGTQVLLVDDKAVVEGELKVLKGGTLAAEKLFVGDDGRDGILIVQSADANNPATVSAAEVVLGDAQNFGIFAGGKGVAAIEGQAKAEFDSLVIGDGGDADFFVSGGSTLQTLLDVTLGKNVGASGTLNLDGAGTTVAVGGNLLVGNSAPLAVAFDGSSVFIDDKARLLVLGDTTVGIESLIAVIGNADGTPSSTLRLGGDLTLEDNSLGAIIEKGGTLEFISSGSSEVVIGFNSQLTVRRDPLDVITDPGVVSTIKSTNGGELKIQIGTLPDLIGGSPDASVRVLQGGLLQMTEISVGRLLVGGDLEVDGGGVTGRKIMVNEFGEVTVSNGGFIVLGSTPFVDGVLLEVAQGTRNIAEEVIVGAGGELKIDGEFQSPNTIINDGGLVQTGSSPGLGSLLGNLTIAEGGQWIVEIAGLTPEVEFDQMFVDGDVTIAGDVILRFLDGFAPQAGDSFGFLSATGDIDLSEASFHIENLQPDFNFDIAPDSSGFLLLALNDGRFIPEPSTFIIMLIATALGAMRGARPTA